MKTIPNNKIIQSKGLGDTIGDIVESFNIDLSSNYGAVRATRTKKVPVASNFEGATAKAFGFVIFQGNYYMITEDFIMGGGAQPSDQFNLAYSNSLINESLSDIKMFNSCIYATSATQVIKSTDGSNYTTPITSGLTTGTPHLLEVMNSGAVSRLYITDNYCKVRSISTSDVLTSDGQAYSLNLQLSSDWTITSLKYVGDLLWISLLNVSNGKGMVVSWDGSSADSRNATYHLPSGVVSSTVLDNVLYIIDTQGIIKRFAGNSFVEVARLPKKNKNFFMGSSSLTNVRFIHPNGMQTTDEGNIQILISNEIQTIGYEDTLPSGVWEYDKNIGLYHKYSPSVSATTGTTFSDYGQQRLYKVGALCTYKPTVPSLTDNGTLLFGCSYFPTSANSTATDRVDGVFCDDSLDTTQKYGYFITSKQFSNTQEQWKKIYTLYKKFINSSSEITIKYRTDEDIPTETIATWTDIDRFTSSVDISSYSVGDEIQILQGSGAGFSAHIASIDGSTYIIDEQLPSSCIGLTTKANISKWKKVGTGKITYSDIQQIKALTISEKNLSPYIQFKVCMKFNGKDELYKLQIISEEQIKE